MTPEQFNRNLQGTANALLMAMRRQVPHIVAEKATAFFKRRFTTKEWDGQPWPATKKKVKRGSLMLRSGNLVNSIMPSTVTPEQIVISAGNNKVPYAQIHNEGGTIQRFARSSLKVQNRFSKGKKKGRFKKGTTSGQGFTYRGGTSTMPKRQFMGNSPQLEAQLTKAIDNVITSIIKS